MKKACRSEFNRLFLLTTETDTALLPNLFCNMPSVPDFQLKKAGTIIPLTLVRQDIAKMKVDVIVNAANTELQIGGVCRAVFRAEGASALSENGNARK